jgi:DNA-binding response OmpR family regulator
VDHNLPGMEGLILGDYLRRNNPDMSIVMMTGSGDPRIERESRNLSLKFMAKPFQVRQVLEAIDEYVELAAERDEMRQARQDRLYDPPIESFVDDLTACYSVPKVPTRVEESLAQTVKQCLNNLKSAARYTERDRVVALSGLLTAQVLGVSLPRTKNGRTLFEEYDHLMIERGRRTEFGAAGPRSARG